LAAVAVLVVAASIWFAVRRVPGPQIETLRTPAPDVTLPAGEPGAGGAGRHEAAAPQPHARAGQATPGTGPRTITVVAARAARPVTGRRPGAGEEMGQQPAVVHDFAIPALPAPDPLPPPDPVLVAPLTVDQMLVERLEIPPLQIDPVEGTPSKERGR
jgi:hypothetical protein